MKIGIVTFHRAFNFGAMLQAFALQTFLSKYNQVHIIDYRCQSIEYAYKPKLSMKNKCKRVIANIIHPFFHQKIRMKNRKFNSFLKTYLKLSKTVNKETICNISSEYDAFVAGSDQIWNVEYTNYDKNYFLNFAPPYKRISYAASFGKSEFDDKTKAFFASMLSDFKYLSVRELDGKKIVNESCGKKQTFVCCDPVYLLSKKEWEEILPYQKQTITNKKYILVYCVQKPEKCLEFAKQYSTEHNLDVIFINNTGDRKKIYFKNNLYSCGPIDFLSLIRDAEIIITTSFHCLSFSLIFEKTFFYELSTSINNKNSRLINVANFFDISDRQIKTSSPSSMQCKTIDWDYIKKRISAYKESGCTFLKESGIINDVNK